LPSSSSTSKTKSVYEVRRLRLDPTPQLDALARASGALLADSRQLLAHGAATGPLVEAVRHDALAYVELGWLEPRCIYRVEEAAPKPPGDETAGVALGEVHLAVVHHGQRPTMINGRALRSKRQYRNMLKATRASKQSGWKRGSRRWRKLQKGRLKQLRKLDHHSRDILH
jgi:putative transposase